MNRSIVLKRKQRDRRKRSVRKNLSGTTDVPRVSVYRSNKHIYAQIIDDQNHKTIVSSSDKALKNKIGKNIEVASLVGEDLGKKAKAKKVEKVVFDRSGYKYHGKIKALADGLRKAGLKF
jgi:large subunit ribosomal protein L18